MHNADDMNNGSLKKMFSFFLLFFCFSGCKVRKDYGDDDDADLINDRNDDLNDGLHADDLDDGAVRGGV